ncbi:MAG: hypothetical protein EOO41_04920, partial [Methanobacteriota archaeon]
MATVQFEGSIPAPVTAALNARILEQLQDAGVYGSALYSNIGRGYTECTLNSTHDDLVSAADAEAAQPGSPQGGGVGDEAGSSEWSWRDFCVTPEPAWLSSSIVAACVQQAMPSSAPASTTPSCMPPPYTPFYVSPRGTTAPAPPQLPRTEARPTSCTTSARQASSIPPSSTPSGAAAVPDVSSAATHCAATGSATATVSVPVLATVPRETIPPQAASHVSGAQSAGVSRSVQPSTSPASSHAALQRKPGSVPLSAIVIDLTDSTPLHPPRSSVATPSLPSSQGVEPLTMQPAARLAHAIMSAGVGASSMFRVPLPPGEAAAASQPVATNKQAHGARVRTLGAVTAAAS